MKLSIPTEKVELFPSSQFKFMIVKTKEYMREENSENVKIDVVGGHH